MYAVKEICRGMAKPREREWNKLKRLARYLSGCGRLATKYEWQGNEDWLEEEWQDNEDPIEDVIDEECMECEYSINSPCGVSCMGF